MLKACLTNFHFPCSDFCTYAILTLGFTYLYMCTFFVAALAIDQKRIDAGRCLVSSNKLGA